MARGRQVLIVKSSEEGQEVVLVPVGRGLAHAVEATGGDDAVGDGQERCARLDVARHERRRQGTGIHKIPPSPLCLSVRMTSHERITLLQRLHKVRMCDTTRNQ